jgi:AcrR family transcriptional regulator
MKAKAQFQTRRDEILGVSSTLFKQKGFSATTMREIADHVGIEAASMYNHIKGKDELLIEICNKVASDYLSGMESIDRKNESALDKLKELITQHIQIVCDNSDGILIATNEWKHLPEPAQTEFKKARQNYENQFLRIIQEGIEKNELVSIDINIALYTILSSVRWIEVWYKPNKKISPDKIKEDILTLLMNGLVKK